MLKIPTKKQFVHHMRETLFFFVLHLSVEMNHKRKSAHEIKLLENNFQQHFSHATFKRSSERSRSERKQFSDFETNGKKKSPEPSDVKHCLCVVPLVSACPCLLFIYIIHLLYKYDKPWK